MSLGSNITRLRQAKGMSQGDLAEALDVSRQSVSKWETDSTIPELDKLLRLSTLFGVTLDYLVTGEEGDDAGCQQTADSPSPEEKAHTGSGWNGQKTAGVIFLCFGGLLTLLLGLFGLFISVPLFICGILCLCLRRRAGFFCAWSVFLMVSVYLRLATGITWQTIFLTPYYAASMNYLRLLTGWVLFFLLVALVIWTVASWSKTPLSPTRGRRVLFAFGAALFILLCSLTRMPLSQEFLLRWGNMWMEMLNISSILLFIILATAFVRYLRWRKSPPEET